MFILNSSYITLHYISYINVTPDDFTLPSIFQPVVLHYTEVMPQAMLERVDITFKQPYTSGGVELS